MQVQARGLRIGARGGETCWHGGLAVRGAALGRAEGRDAGAGGEGGPNARGRARGGWWSARGGHAGAGSGRCGRVGWRSHRGGRNEVERRSFSGEFFISINSFSSIAIGFDYRISISSPPIESESPTERFHSVLTKQSGTDLPLSRSTQNNAVKEHPVLPRGN